MSGVAGIVEFFNAQPMGCDHMNRMLNVMSYRGPEGRSSRNIAGAIFGHLALDATGQQGHQPLERNGVLLVADAHLTQRDRLCSDLYNKSIKGNISDPELLMEAYLRWGKKCVHHVHGSFAFVVYDGDSLFMARDHLGVKPIYYTETRERRFVFASEARAVARETKAPVNRARIADALVFPLEHVDKVSTPYEGVYRLPPGTLLTADQHGISVEQYWDGSDVARLELDDAAWVSRFREILLDVLEDHRTGSDSVAVALSGGVDSATVACVAAGHGLPVHVYSTILPEHQACPDTQHIHLAVSRAGLDATLISPTFVAEEKEALLDQLSNLQEPFDTHMLQLMILNLAAARAGHRYLLDGVEGELIYSMPGSYPTLLFREGRVFDGFREAWLSSRSTGGNPIASLYTSIRGLGAPVFLQTIKSRLAQKLETSLVEDSWISPRFAEETVVERRLAEMRSRLYGGRPGMFETHRRSVTHPAIGAALERYDRVAALSGIESRHPLLDLRLVELMLATPDHLKVRHGWSKYLLRLAGAPDVPAEISWRTDKAENAWSFSEELARLAGSPMRRFLQQNRSTLDEYVKTDANIEDENLPELFGFCHWLVNQQREQTL